ncbi:MAG: hypothetical protein WC659_04870 [Patescibacteria group bacterium]
MTIVLCASMSFAKEVTETALALERAGHNVLRPLSHELWLEHGMEKGKEGELEFMREYDLMRKHYEHMKRTDALVVLNYEKRGTPGYIGGGVLMEMGFAHVLHKPIYLLQPLPEAPYRDEIEVMNPILLHGNLKNIPIETTPPLLLTKEGIMGEVKGGQMKRVATYGQNDKENGFLMELLKEGRFTKAYLTSVFPESFKGYHLHRVRETNYAAVRGKMHVVLYAIHGQGWRRTEYVLDSAQGDTLHIPVNVATGFESATKEEAWMINFPEPAYDPELKDEQVEYSQEELIQGIVK